MGTECDGRGGAVDGGGNRCQHDAMPSCRASAMPSGLKLVDQQPPQFELAGRTGIAVGFGPGGGVDLHVTQKTLQERWSVHGRCSVRGKTAICPAPYLP